MPTKKPRISVTLNSEVYEYLKNGSKNKNVSVSNLVETIIDGWIKKQINNLH